MRVFIFFILTILSAQAALSAQTGTSWLYDIDINLTSQNQKAAQHSALQQVVDRLTPGPDDHENPVINSADPHDFIESMQPGENDSTRIKFRPEAISRLMLQAGMQPWILNHPKILTRVCTFNYPDLHCLNPEKNQEMFRAIAAAARAKGLDLEFATGAGVYIPDFHDEKLFLENLPENSQSVPPEAQLLIKLMIDRQKDVYVYEKWYAYYRNQFSGFNHQVCKRPPEQIGRLSMPGISKFMFQQGEEIKKASHPVDIRIGNIQTAADYYRLEEYLKNIPGVGRTSLNSVTADAVLYTLDITIPTGLLEMRLAQKYTTLPADPDQGILNYRVKL